MNFFAQYMPGNGDIPLKIPWGIDEILITGVSGFKNLALSFPPFGVIMQAFLIYIGFKIIMQLLKGVPILGRTIR